MTSKKFSLFQLLLTVTSLLCLVEQGISGRLQVRSADESDSWCYQKADCKQGTPGTEWESGFCATGNHQSPIDLDPTLPMSQETIDFSASKDKYAIDGYKIINSNGNGLQISPKTLKASFNWKDSNGTNREFKLVQLHFHWGPDDGTGAEHNFDRQSFSMELHMVHYNGKHEDFSKAIASGEKDALAVIGVMIQANESVTTATELGPISDALQKVIDPNHEFEIASKPLNLDKFIKLPSAKAFTYFGSLTIPGCFEVVNWLVLREPYMVRASEVAAFRSIKDRFGNPLLRTYRNIQDIANRTVSVLKVT